MKAAARASGFMRGLLVRFGIVGVVATATDVAVFNLAHFGRGLDPLTSKAIAAAVAMVVAYAGSRWWAFRQSAGARMSGEFVRFVIANVMALGIAELCLVVSYYLLGLHSIAASNVSANVVGQLLATAFRFWAYSVWVFPPSPLSAAHSARPKTPLHEHERAGSTTHQRPDPLIGRPLRARSF